jgi:hypothetical protein
MRAMGAAKVGFWIAVTGSIAIVSAVGSSASLTACGESAGCTALRNDTYAAKETWDACNPADGPGACIKVPGNTKDCTGVLSCDFAVNPVHRAEAEQAVETIAQRSQGCYLCATPNCIGGDITYCEPVSRRCILVSEITEAGIVYGGDLEAAAPPAPTDTTPVNPIPTPDGGAAPGTH